MQTLHLPSGVERPFGRDEIIVTKTDTAGRITYANQVFLRVAAYDEDDVLGRPHNIVRHPDMPRGVFKLLWDTIAAGDEIFAYVLNLASDGGHYWVFAHVTPSLDADKRVTGYHSNRRYAPRTAVAAVEPIYRRMLRAEAQEGRATAAAAAGVECLHDQLAEAGSTYDQLVWSVTHGAAS